MMKDNSCFILIKCRGSHATPTTSWIFLSSRMPHFSKDIDLQRIGSILQAVFLALILYIALQREMG